MQITDSDKYGLANCEKDKRQPAKKKRLITDWAGIMKEHGVLTAKEYQKHSGTNIHAVYKAEWKGLIKIKKVYGSGKNETNSK